MDALAFIGKTNAQPEPLYVLHGDEAFLKRHALAAVRRCVLGPDNDDSAITAHPGDKAAFAQVWDELETAPFFAARRLVIVENADPFVTRFRTLLEKKINSVPTTGTLVLDVKSWPPNTRLAKMVDPAVTVVCKAPAAYQLAAWCAEWCAKQYQKQLAVPAAQLLMDLAGTEMGLLDQELQKLTVYVGDRKKIDSSDVDKLVGQSRTESTFKILDAIAENRPAEALRLLDRLFDQGEEPMRMLGAFGLQMRRLAQAGRLAIQGVPLSAALGRVGVPPFGIAPAEKQLKHLGRRRAALLYSWLVDLTMGLRGGNPLPERTQFERLVIRLARPQDKADTLARRQSAC